MSEPLIEVKNLKKYFPIRGGVLQRTIGYVKAVDGVSFTINKGETLSLVGESGCGKSTVGRTIIRLYDKTDGDVLFKGIPIHSLKKSELRKLRPKMQMVFQDPFSSLNPRLRIGDAVGEALLDHGLVSKNELRDRVIEALEMCGLASYHIDRYPHEFSGGQRQRIGIARALILDPEFIVLDEPVSSLDVSIQAQIINLLMDLQQQKGLTYLFISHDLSVVEHISTRVAVMYLGNIVEMASRDELFDHPLHPYTQALLSAVPIPDPDLKRERIILEGDIPSPANPPKGCKFHTRCPFAKDICKEQVPEFRDVGGGHYVACHLV
ncbi:ABC transporter ATP-binding protein [Caldanaerobacter subterraneus]|jgi:oligopeptide transport system ATP-binding protein|uniref:ABC-type dipeptide/oligopeptide/nickel transport system, ATPase component n=4 Tax=Caldanaerobacter subterraneus TaxID=911092 RepID=Q8R793_CALS4|nr:ABC transporter ATP-binding protein [Caldanaerobacter subterraneus]MDK2794286.1 peptide/nickel transport system ATP-binding protein [Caldanaerobacter sp.]AAM25655.1 ABC-type dipeptide/oligopeptide/nickel transport system, ATPase component [Caldanaerobacter subterraneus subsp. tengcongensis MB4]ERM91226.1 peptide ABC transporter ATP-binding protein [Caldanaerobacter subterraneus subsp. yonseiensis KB-1]MCS3917472.1 oligopeptide transport system ATP-binding protein [Caldanaerobacter subterrane